MQLHPQLLQGLRDLGFEGTRPVQGAVVPRALEGGDVVACAETGTGKTLAFALPILQRLMSEMPPFGDPARERFTRALILAPTRPHPIRETVRQARAIERKRRDESDVKLFLLSFGAFFISFTTFLL